MHARNNVVPLALTPSSSLFMEYLLFAILTYFILRTAGNLVGIMQGDDPSRRIQDRQNGRDRSADHGWKGPSPRDRTGTAKQHPTYWGEDVDDATWQDIG